jgi:hypothetical protein
MVGIALSSVCILGAALLVSAVEASNPSYTDRAGDVETSGPSGWAGQHIDYLQNAPTLGSTPPVALDAFGQSQPSESLSAGRAINLKGATAGRVPSVGARSRS